MSFKLLAIRPTENCGKKFLKNLEINPNHAVEIF